VCECVVCVVRDRMCVCVYVCRGACARLCVCVCVCCVCVCVVCRSETKAGLVAFPSVILISYVLCVLCVCVVFAWISYYVRVKMIITILY